MATACSVNVGRYDVGVWVILRWILRDRIGWDGLDCSGSREGLVEDSCEHSNEHSGSIKCWEVLERLHYWQHLKKNTAPWS
jgi:hypothetical protein